MKASKFLFSILFLFLCFTVFAQQTTQTKKGLTVNNQGAAVKSSNNAGVAVQKKSAGATNSKGAGATVNSKGTSVKNSNGAGLDVHKNQVAAKSSTGKGVEANKKGLEVKGSKGGLTVEKKHFEIKSKNVNIKLGN